MPANAGERCGGDLRRHVFANFFLPTAERKIKAK